MMKEWVSAALAHSGMNQTQLAKALSDRLARRVYKAAVNKMLKDGRQVKADEMLAMSEITGYPIPGMTLVPIISRVSAGQLLDPYAQIPVENAKRLQLPDLKPGDYFGLQVEGDSMDRLSPPGSIIVVDRGDREPRDGKPYVFATSEGATYKRWRTRPARLEPYSTNPVHQPIFLEENDDARVIGRVIRTTLTP